jgi:hypothetical protein
VTFSFTAVGRPDDVIRQIRSHHATDDQLGVKVRDLITDAIAMHAASDDSWPAPGGWGYIVKASGYSGHHSGAMVSLSIESLYIPGMVPAEAPAIGEQLAAAVDGEPVLDPQRDY